MGLWVMGLQVRLERVAGTVVTGYRIQVRGYRLQVTGLQGYRVTGLGLRLGIRDWVRVRVFDGDGD
jgi:hypothetical protein